MLKTRRAMHLILGAFTEGEDDMEVFNPSTGQAIGTVPITLPRHVNLEEMGRWAHSAQEAWHWEVPEQLKEAVFQAIAVNFEIYRGELAKTMVIESGKLWRWADAEVQEVIDTIWHYHGEISRYHTKDGFGRCQLSDKNAFSVLMPYGNFLTIKPWNFPAAVPMWSICGALAGGNSILVKPAEQTPFTMELVAKTVKKSLADVLDKTMVRKLEGLIQTVNGIGHSVGKRLLEDYDYDKVTFTGSDITGKIVAQTAGSRLKPCHLELGGHAAMVVLDDFDIDLAVQEAINANLGDSGQRCVSTRVVFVQESRYKEFLEKYLSVARARRIGNPMDLETEMGPLISKEQLEQVHNMVVETGIQSGRQPLIGGHLLKGSGYFYPPTVFTEVPYGMTAMDNEIFGPVIVINPLSGRNREEAFWNAVELVNRSKYGLSNALLTNDRRLSSCASGRFKTGIFYIGRGTTGAELNKYFGGVKSSGWGREGRGLDDWTQVQQVYDDYHGKPRMAQSGGVDQETLKRILSSHSRLDS